MLPVLVHARARLVGARCGPARRNRGAAAPTARSSSPSPRGSGARGADVQDLPGGDELVHALHLLRPGFGGGRLTGEDERHRALATCTRHRPRGRAPSAPSCWTADSSIASSAFSARLLSPRRIPSPARSRSRAVRGLRRPSRPLSLPRRRPPARPSPPPDSTSMQEGQAQRGFLREDVLLRALTRGDKPLLADFDVVGGHLCFLLGDRLTRSRRRPAQSPDLGASCQLAALFPGPQRLGECFALPLGAFRGSASSSPAWSARIWGDEASTPPSRRPPWRSAPSHPPCGRRASSLFSMVASAFFEAALMAARAPAQASRTTPMPFRWRGGSTPRRFPDRDAPPLRSARCAGRSPTVRFVARADKPIEMYLRPRVVFGDVNRSACGCARAAGRRAAAPSGTGIGAFEPRTLRRRRYGRGGSRRRRPRKRSIRWRLRFRPRSFPSVSFLSPSVRRRRLLRGLPASAWPSLYPVRSSACSCPSLFVGSCPPCASPPPPPWPRQDWPKAFRGRVFSFHPSATTGPASGSFPTAGAFAHRSARILSERDARDFDFRIVLRIRVRHLCARSRPPFLASRQDP